MALHLRLSWSPTGVTQGLTCHATNHLVTRRQDGVLSLPKDHHVRAFQQVEWQPLLCARHQTARVHGARRGSVVAEGLASPLHDVLQRNNIMHPPQSGWCDAGPQRGPASRGEGLKALSTPCSPLLDVATQCCCGGRTGDGAPHPDETRLMAALPLQGERRQAAQLLYPLGTPERQSLCASHPQRRELTHVALRAFHRATPGLDRTRLVKQVRQRRRFEPDIGVTADAFGRKGQDIAVQVAHERADGHFQLVGVPLLGHEDQEDGAQETGTALVHAVFLLRAPCRGRQHVGFRQQGVQPVIRQVLG